jgi:hypothetical protein
MPKKPSPALLLSRLENQIKALKAIEADISQCEHDWDELPIRKEHLLQHRDYRDEEALKEISRIDAQLSMIEPTFERLKQKRAELNEVAVEMEDQGRALVGEAFHPAVTSAEMEIEQSALQAVLEASKERTLSQQEKKWVIDAHKRENALHADLHRWAIFTGQMLYSQSGNLSQLTFMTKALEVMVRKEGKTLGKEDLLDVLKATDAAAAAVEAN